MTEERRSSVDAPEEIPGETGFAPPDKPAESPSDKLVVSREAAEAAAPPATMLDGVAVQPGGTGPQPVGGTGPQQVAGGQQAPRYGDQPVARYQDQMPQYQDAPPPYQGGGYGEGYGEQRQSFDAKYGEPHASYQEPGRPSYGEPPQQRPGFAPHAPGAFWPGTQPQNPPPPPPHPGLGGGQEGPPNWAPVPPPPAQPRRSPGFGAFAVLALVIALLAGTVGAGIAMTFTGDDSADSSSPVSLSNSKGDEPRQVRDPKSVAGIAQRVLPSVVTVKVTVGGEGGSGTGFIVKDGYIITNNHVVAAGGAGGTPQIEVEFSDNKEVAATVVGTSKENDVAVLKIQQGSHDLPALELGNSDALTVGDPVIAIGSPLGLSGSVTTGIISAKNRVVPTRSETGGDGGVISALQTDAAINPGNSGGPLVDAATGKVIGMNTAIASLNESGGESGNIGLGFAIPINKVAAVATKLINGETVKRTIIGISMDLQYTGEGVRILQDGGSSSRPPVTPNGPADKAGLKAGDVIVNVDGKAITNPDSLINLINSKAPGDRIKVTFRRGGQEQTVEVTLGQSN